MLNLKTPLWFLDETFGYFILQRPLEDITEADIQLTIDGRTLRLEVEKLELDESFRLPRSVDTQGMTWTLMNGMLTLTLRKAPLGRAIRIAMRTDEMGNSYGEYNFDHMFPPNNPPEAFLDEDEEVA